MGLQGERGPKVIPLKPFLLAYIVGIHAGRVFDKLVRDSAVIWSTKTQRFG